MKEMIRISNEFIEDSNEWIREALNGAFTKLLEKYGESEHVAAYVHVALCIAMEYAYECAPRNKEAERFILQALQKVKELKK